MKSRRSKKHVEEVADSNAMAAAAESAGFDCAMLSSKSAALQEACEKEKKRKGKKKGKRKLSISHFFISKG